MRSAEGRGRTLDEAVDAALIELGESRRNVEANGERRKLPLVVDDERRERAGNPGYRRKRNLGIITRGHIDAIQVDRALLILRIDLEYDSILVALCVKGRDLPLRIGIVERVGYVLHAHVQARCRGTVDSDVRLQAALLAVRRYVHQPGNALHACVDVRGPTHEFRVIRAPNGELIGRIRLPRADPKVLRGDKEDAHPRHVGHALPKTVGNL